MLVVWILPIGDQWLLPSLCVLLTCTQPPHSIEFMEYMIEISQRSGAVVFYGRLKLQSGFTEDREANYYVESLLFTIVYNRHKIRLTSPFL